MSSECPVSQLSQELIDKILDHVAADSSDRLGGTLLQCAFVSRSFRPRSQLYIFSSIDIRGDSETREDRIRNLFNIIQDNPEIAHYIEELSLECTDNEYSWIFDDQAFIDLMSKISNSDCPLRKLTIKADTEADDGYNSLPLGGPELFLDRFFLPFIGPFIKSLSLHRLLDVPIEAVTSCASLTDLELLHVEFRDRKQYKHSTSHSLKLQRLAHRLSRPALSTLISPLSDESSPALDLSQLESFTVYTDELSDLQFEQKIIDVSRRSLEELRLITMQTSWNGIFHGSADLQYSTRLRSIHAHVLFPEDSLISMQKTLSSVRTKSLGSLRIEAKVAYCGVSQPEVVLDANWADFCSELARVMTTSAGSSFEFKMVYQYRDSTNMEMEEYEALLQKRCQFVIDELRRDRLSLLASIPHLSLTLSYALEFDAFYEYTWGEDAYE